MKILFSLPVHENMEVVINTIENINKFVKEPQIVIHVNPIFRDFDHTRLDQFHNVIVNPTRLSYKKYHSMLGILMANYYHTRDLDYDYHCFFYSNEMFIKHGIEEYIFGFDCVFENYFQNEINDRFKEMTSTCKIKDFFDNEMVINNHVEGTMYSKSLIDRIFNFVEKNLLECVRSQSNIEETIIPTLAYMFTTPDKRQHPYNLFQDWDRELSIAQIDDLRNSSKPILVGHTAYNISGTTDQIYTVKPIHRNIGSKSRQYISNL